MIGNDKSDPRVIFKKQVQKVTRTSYRKKYKIRKAGRRMRSRYKETSVFIS